MSGPSQPKVEDEQWSDERIRGFLSLKPQDIVTMDEKNWYNDKMLDLKLICN